MPKPKNMITKPYSNLMPWERQNASLHKHDQTELSEITQFEENEFLNKLNGCSSEQFPANIRRLRRKLLLKRLKGIYMQNENTSTIIYALRNSHYCVEYGNGWNSLDFGDESIVGIIPTVDNKTINCTYTDRKLKPIIRRGTYKLPLYISMFIELKEKLNSKYPKMKQLKYNPSAVEFLYVQPHHIPSINALVNSYFWPLIDMNCVLQYSEFSCVALYKKIVVGFGFLFPGEHLNEGYISFLFVRPHWRNCGIASFILYHLIQTSFTWDHTLHVSMSNPSLLLYQKFGFKFQRIYSGFYNKYLSSDSKQSRNAVYCKLDSDI